MITVTITATDAAALAEAVAALLPQLNQQEPVMDEEGGQFARVNRWEKR